MTLSRRQFVKGASVAGAVAGYPLPFSINQGHCANKELRIYMRGGWYITWMKC